MSARRPVRVLIVLERPTIDGVAKPMLEFAAQAAGPGSSGAAAGTALEISFAIFARRRQALDNALTQSARACGVTVYLIDERYVYDVRVIRKLREAVQRSGADVIVTNGFKTHFLIWLAGVHRNCRWVAFHHGYTSENLKILLYNKLGRWAMRRAPRVLTVCSAFATELAREGVPADRIRIQQIPVRPFPPVPPEAVERLRVEMKLPANAQVLISVGRLSSEKGHADLIRAVTRLREKGRWPSLYLLILGAGVERERLNALSERLGLADSVRFPGFQENVSHYLALADLFVLPSHSEGCPNVLLEAMAAGVPVVATAVGGVPEIAKNEQSALLVGRGDTEAMARAISRLLSDPALCARLTASARLVVTSHAPEVFVRLMTACLLDEEFSEEKSGFTCAGQTAPE